MSDKVVIGIGFGDEGKGLVTDWLCSKDPKNTQVVRYSGGHQAGHCVTTDNDKHIFSNFGSGTLRGCPTWWNAMTCDPVGIVREYEQLKTYEPELFINPSTPITTPWDKKHNRLLDATNDHGSVGVGFGATIQREEDNYHLLFRDIFFPVVLAYKLEAIANYYSGVEVDQEDIDIFMDSCTKVINLVGTIVDRSVSVFESSQGMMLDMDYGFFPNVTRSRVGTQTLNLDLDTDEVYLVTRAYQTRHGNGPHGSFIYGIDNDDETNHTNPYQGKFKTFALDLSLLAYAYTSDSSLLACKNTNLVITCMDLIPDYRYALGNDLYYADDENQFVSLIKSMLPGVKNVYLSYGPKATDIVKWEENK